MIKTLNFYKLIFIFSILLHVTGASKMFRRNFPVKVPQLVEPQNAGIIL